MASGRVCDLQGTYVLPFVMCESVCVCASGKQKQCVN
jgi:hypothetical protein